MADYDLGTAHGRIVIDYKDDGTVEAGKSLDDLRSKARGLLGQFSDMARKWRADGNSMASTATTVAKSVGAITGVAVAAHVAMNGFGASLGILREVQGAVGGLATALGAVPAGMEGFPSAVRRIVQVNAAVLVLTATLGILDRATRGIAGVRVVTGLLGKFGGVLTSLTGPLRLVSSLAFAAVTAFKAFGFIKQLIKIMSIFTGVVGGLGATVHVIAGLAASIRDLSGAALLIPAGVGAAALVLGTFKIGLLGVSDALKEMDDPAKFAEALKKLTPAAREAVIAIKGLQPAFNTLKADVQERLFAGLGTVIAELGGVYLPILQSAMGKVATSFNVAIKDVAAFFNVFEGSREVPNDVAEGFDFLAKGIDNLTKGIGPVVQALYLIGRVGAEVFAEITTGAGSAAERFLDFIAAARSSGKLREVMLTGVQAVKDLIAIVLNLGKILTTVFDGINNGSGQTFLGFLREGTQRVLEFLRSVEGQSALATFGAALERIYTNASALADAFIKYVLPAIQAFSPIVDALSRAITTGLVVAMRILSPLFVALGDALSVLAPVIGPIVTVLVALTTTLIGLGVAFGIVSKVLLLFRVAGLAIRGVVAIVTGVFRLLTGTLGPVGKAILALARFLGGALLKAIFSVATALKLLKFGGIALAIGSVIGALQGYSAEVTKTFENGNFGQDVLTFWEQLKAQPFTTIGKEIRASLTPPPTAAADFAAVGNAISTFFTTTIPAAAAKVRASFETDFIGFFAGLPARIGTALSTLGTTVSTKLTEVGTAVAALPTIVGTALATFGTFLMMKANEVWTSFITATNTKFVELGGTVGTLPYRLGVALGSLIGMGLKWATDLWNSFKLATETKFAEITTAAAALPGRIGAALTAFGETLRAKATEAWESFRASSQAKSDAAIADVRALPGKAGAALGALGSQISSKAQEAWSQFKARASALIDQAVADIRAVPGKAGAAISGLVGILRAKGTEAMNGFKTAVSTGASAAIAFVQGIPGRISGALGNLGGLLVGAGRSVIDGLLSGIRAGVANMYSFVSGIAAGIAARKGPISYDRTLLVPAGNAIIQGLRAGMEQEMPALYSMVSKIAPTIQSSLSGAGAAAQEILDRLRSGGPVFEDFSFKGASSLVGKYNDQLADMFYKNGQQFNGKDMTGFLETYVKSQTTKAAAPKTPQGGYKSFASTPIPYSAPKGNTDLIRIPEPGSNTFHITMPASDIAEMQAVSDFFNKVQQKARAGKASG